MRPEHSIRRRLVRRLVASVALLLALVGVIAESMLERHVHAEFDAALAAKARALATLTKPSDGGFELDFADELMPEFSAARQPEYFELRDRAGASIERSRSLRGAPLPQIGASIASPGFVDLELPDGRRGRAVRLDFSVHAEDDGDDREAGTGLGASITLARGREALDALLARLRIGLGAATLLVLAAIALVSRLSIERGLAPLDQLNAQVARIDAGNLSARLEPTERLRETDAIVAQFNALLERLENAFDRERRFSANAAHELRTPIAEIRSLADVARRWSGDAELSRRSLDDIALASRHLERLVATLLALARNERRLDIWPERVVDLAEALDAAWRRRASDAVRRRIRWQRDGAASLRVRIAPEPLTRILDNLVANAIEYAPEGATIRARLGPTSGGIELALENPAPALTDADLERMREPLWRGDAARPGGEHLGLGLSLVRSYAALLGLEPSLSRTTDGAFRVVLTGPLALAELVEREREPAPSA